jgi:hypothetical protein
MSKLTVLADGTCWIWEESTAHLASASEVLDVFHAAEHIAAAAQKIYGEGTNAAQAWTEQTHEKLLLRAGQELELNCGRLKSRFGRPQVGRR